MVVVCWLLFGVFCLAAVCCRLLVGVVSDRVVFCCALLLFDCCGAFVVGCCDLVLLLGVIGVVDVVVVCL